MAQRHQRHVQVIGAFVRIPEQLEDGKVRCNGCSAIVTLTPNGRIRAHKSPAGEDCAYTASYAPPVHLEETPPVVIPPAPLPPSIQTTVIKKRAPKWRPSADAIAQDARRAPRDEACVDCGRWIPEMRTLCGQCARRRQEGRR